MPAQIIHSLAGADARGISLSVPTLGAPSANSAFYQLGCQGPDIFSHNRRTRPFALAFSRLLHRRDYGRFCAAFASELLRAPDNAALAWFYGFVTHQAVDRVLHPYIVYRSYIDGNGGIEGVNPALFHAFLERLLDSAFLAHHTGRSVSSFDTGAVFAVEPAAYSRVADAIASALLATYASAGVDSSEAEVAVRVRNAFADAIYFYQVTNPSVIGGGDHGRGELYRRYEDLGPSGVALLYPETPDPATDWLNLAHSRWSHPASGAVHTASVPELYAQAVEQAAAAQTQLRRCLAEEIDPVSFGAEIGNSCLSVAGEDGLVAPVIHFEPFDLAGRLLAETERRRDWLRSAVC